MPGHFENVDGLCHLGTFRNTTRRSLHQDLMIISLTILEIYFSELIQACKTDFISFIDLNFNGFTIPVCQDCSPHYMVLYTSMIMPSSKV